MQSLCGSVSDSPNDRFEKMCSGSLTGSGISPETVGADCKYHPTQQGYDFLEHAQTR